MILQQQTADVDVTVTAIVIADATVIVTVDFLETTDVAVFCGS